MRTSSCTTARPAPAPPPVCYSSPAFLNCFAPRGLHRPRGNYFASVHQHMSLSLNHLILSNPESSAAPAITSARAAAARKPSWLKMKMPQGQAYLRLKEMVESHRLHTVCQSAKCPNLGEC